MSQDLRRDGAVNTEPVNQGRPRSKVVGGRFVIERLIARGGMGAVYLSHQLNLGRPVALKIMTPPPDADDSDTFEERFRLEAETLASLHHPNIVTVYDYGPTDDGRYYLALEYIDGPRFTDLIRKGRMAPERVVALMLQVCNGLQYSHKRGVVHRDLKPSNLLVRVEDGVETVKVVDFGLVKVVEADQSLTRAGLVLGSPHCMAPEQVRGVEIDHRADIYAIGILLFRSLTGTWPFHGETVAATMVAHVHEEVPTFFSVAPDLMVPDGLEEITRRCMAKAPDERFQDVAELMDALAGCLDVPKEQFLTVSSYHSSLKGKTDDLPVHGGASGRRWLPVALAALLLLGVVGILALRPSPEGAGPTEAAATPAPAAAQPAVAEDAAPADAAPEDAAPEDAAPEDAVASQADELGSALAADGQDPAAEVAETEAAGSAAEPAGSSTAGSSSAGASSAGAAAPRPQPASKQPAARAGSGSSASSSSQPATAEPAAAPDAEGDAPEGYMPLPDDF